MTTNTINIDMDKECAKCGKPGATPGGLCLDCVAKSMVETDDRPNWVGHWAKASPAVINMAQSIIDKYHPHLKTLRIGFLFRDEAPTSKGHVTLGKASKVNDRMRAFVDLDFIIWIAEDVWTDLTTERREALIDHELCHCGWSPMDGAFIRHHDVEEFVEIIERHGFWTRDLLKVEQIAKDARQLTLDLPDDDRGGVIAMDPQQFQKVSAE